MIAKIEYESIKGTVEKIIFHNKETGFSVLIFKGQNNKTLFTVVGSCHGVYVGSHLIIEGHWHHDIKYGQQFKAITTQVIQPTSIEGIIKYLSSGIIKGIGPSMATKIVSVFEKESLNIIKHQPELLLEVNGIGKNKLQSIISGWIENEAAHEVILFFQNYNISNSTAMRIFRFYGEKAISIAQENPYQLAYDIKGMGFITADKIAISMGMPIDSQQRANAGIEYVLQQAANLNGCCSLPYDILLGKCESDIEIPRIASESAIENALTSKRLIALNNSVNLSGNLIFLSMYFYMERNISSMLHMINHTRSSIEINIKLENAIDWLYQQHKIRLSNSQQEALGTIIQNKVTIVTGGPGTGKTTLIKSLLKVLKHNNENISIKLAAPTGRAAKRMAESAMTHATTIHRLLEFDPINGGFSYNENNKLKCDLLVIDESSMIDIHLMHSVLKALPITSSLVLVGDIDQLPSVGPGQILADLIGSQVLSVIRLNKIFRQASYSDIVTSAHMINKGYMPPLGENSSDFKFIECSPELVSQHISQIILKFCQDMSCKKAMESIQVLTPMQRTGLGVQSLNSLLQSILNPLINSNKPYIEKNGIQFHIGDKVMQTENDYDKNVFNGDIGYIQSVDKENDEVFINFDRRLVCYDLSALDSVVLAYAITIHKSQGSEYNKVIIPIVKQHYIMLNRNLIYTGITRAKEEVILIGEKEAMRIAISNNRISERYSHLKTWLQQEIY